MSFLILQQEKGPKSPCMVLGRKGNRSQYNVLLLISAWLFGQGLSMAAKAQWTSLPQNKGGIGWDGRDRHSRAVETEESSRNALSIKLGTSSHVNSPFPDFSGISCDTRRFYQKHSSLLGSNRTVFTCSQMRTWTTLLLIRLMMVCLSL